MIIVFTVNDVNKEFERLSNLEVKILPPLANRPWGAGNK